MKKKCKKKMKKMKKEYKKMKKEEKKKEKEEEECEEHEIEEYKEYKEYKMPDDCGCKGESVKSETYQFSGHTPHMGGMGGFDHHPGMMMGMGGAFPMMY